VCIFRTPDGGVHHDGMFSQGLSVGWGMFGHGFKRAQVMGTACASMVTTVSS
jgi:hypothetical protein